MGEFFLTLIAGMRPEGVVHCADCKARWDIWATKIKLTRLEHEISSLPRSHVDICNWQLFPFDVWLLQYSSKGSLVNSSQGTWLCKNKWLTLTFCKIRSRFWFMPSGNEQNEELIEIIPSFTPWIPAPNRSSTIFLWCPYWLV